MKIGAQMYTVREFCKTAEDFEQSVKKVAEIGYEGLQYSPYLELGEKNLRNAADKYGFPIVVTHCDRNKLLQDPQAVMEGHKILGTRDIGIGSMPNYDSTLQCVLNFINSYKPVAELLHKSGFKLQYHNHDFEFEKLGGKLVMDYLLDAFPPEQLGFILDVFWVQAGGADPAYWIKKLRGRIDIIHFKDYAMAEGRQRKMAEVMEGNLNWDAIIDACRETGVQWIMVEQDNCYGRDPFESLKISFDNLKRRGL